MSGVKHTPWRWEVDDSGCVHVMGDDWNFIPLISPFRESVFEGDKEALANARLIASAPDLLEALGQLLGNAEIARFYLKDTEEGILVGSALFDTIQQARAAIARARGEQDGGGE